MTSSEYDHFTAHLSARLAADERVLALVALGSMAEPLLRDEQSDHDFVVIVRPGEKCGVLNDVSWLPDTEEVAAFCRQGDRYVTALYQNGHIVEYGVFEPAEIGSRKLSHYSVLFDHAGLADRFAEIRSQSRAPGSDRDARSECELLMVCLLTGVRRATRGEFLSAHKYIAYFAPDILLALLLRHKPDVDPVLIDVLDPWRRFEWVDPPLAAELRSAVQLPPVEAAARLLRIAERELSPRLPEYPAQAAAVVRRALEDLRDPEDEGGNRALR